MLIGTRNGVLYWLDYPLKVAVGEIGKFHITDGIRKIKMHSEPINHIGITNNFRFLVINIQKCGYFSLRMKR